MEINKQCENCGSTLRTCGKCGWSKVYEEDLSHLRGTFDSPSTQEEIAKLKAEHEAYYRNANHWNLEHTKAVEEIDRLREANKQLEEERNKALSERNEWKGEAILQGKLYLEKQSRALQAEKERDIAVKALEKYADMIVLDSEDRPHDVGQLARETLSEINKGRSADETTS